MANELSLTLRQVSLSVPRTDLVAIRQLFNKAKGLDADGRTLSARDLDLLETAPVRGARFLNAKRNLRDALSTLQETRTRLGSEISMTQANEMDWRTFAMLSNDQARACLDQILSAGPERAERFANEVLLPNLLRRVDAQIETPVSLGNESERFVAALVFLLDHRRSDDRWPFFDAAKLITEPRMFLREFSEVPLRAQNKRVLLRAVLAAESPQTIERAVARFGALNLEEARMVIDEALTLPTSATSRRHIILRAMAGLNAFEVVQGLSEAKLEALLDVLELGDVELIRAEGENATAGEQFRVEDALGLHLEYFTFCQSDVHEEAPDAAWRRAIQARRLLQNQSLDPGELGRAVLALVDGKSALFLFGEEADTLLPRLDARSQEHLKRQILDEYNAEVPPELARRSYEEIPRAGSDESFIDGDEGWDEADVDVDPDESREYLFNPTLRGSF